MADDLNRVSREQNVLLPLWTLENWGNKLVRIRRLTPFLLQGKIRFKGNSPGARLLVQQMRDFPNGDHDDGPDALEMAIRVMVEVLKPVEQDFVEEVWVA